MSAFPTSSRDPAPLQLNEIPPVRSLWIKGAARKSWLGVASELSFKRQHRPSLINGRWENQPKNFGNKYASNKTEFCNTFSPKADSDLGANEGMCLGCASASNLDPWRNRCNSLHSNNLREKRGVTVGSRSNTLKKRNSASASTIWLSIGVGSKLDADSHVRF